MVNNFEDNSEIKFRKNMMELKPKQKNKCEIKWREMGKLFGYPQCCIDSFVNKLYTPKRSRVAIFVSKHTGFIPCSYCSWKVLSKKCKLEDLIVNRTSNKPFCK
jgi:hypothetical protein